MASAALVFALLHPGETRTLERLRPDGAGSWSTTGDWEEGPVSAVPIPHFSLQPLTQELAQQIDADGLSAIEGFQLWTDGVDLRTADEQADVLGDQVRVTDGAVVKLYDVAPVSQEWQGVRLAHSWAAIVRKRAVDP